MDARSMEAQEMIPASRKLGRDDAATLAQAARRVVIAKGKKVDDFAGDDTTSDACVDRMLGPTGNLRAPTIRVGKTVVVGFHDDVYRDVLG